MPDIMKFIVNEKANKTDPTGRMLELGKWSKAIALKSAAADGLTVTDDHWRVIGFLRQYYREHGPALHAREIAHALEQRFMKDGGRKHLRLLFPKGPVSQGSRIAGLPVPGDAQDRSFGISL